MSLAVTDGIFRWGAIDWSPRPLIEPLSSFQRLRWAHSIVAVVAGRFVADPPVAASISIGVGWLSSESSGKHEDSGSPAVT